MHKYAKLLDEIIGLVSIEQYGVSGVLHGDRLLVSALREGSANAYAFDGENLVKLNKKPINGVLEAKYGSRYAVFIRDVGAGRELYKLYRVDPDNPGAEEEVPGVEPARILGGAYDDERIVYTAATMAEIALFEARGGGVEKITSMPGMGFVTDLRYPLAVGVLIPIQEPKYKLFIANLEEKSLKIYESPLGSIGAVRISPSGEIVFSVTGAREAQLMRLNASSMEAEKLRLPHSDLDEYHPVSFNYIGYTPSGSLIAVARKNGRSEIFVDGKRVEAPKGMHGAAYIWKGMIVTTHTSLSTPPRIIGLGEEGVKELLRGSAPSYVYEALSGSEFVLVDSVDGEKVPTFILRSRRASEPGPTVVLVHGGPFSEDADMWHTFAAALALAGFHVVMPNYRGSTGYGEEWRMKILGDPCGKELEDIVSAAKWAKESGLASRVYIMGYSYGGYMTLCALTRKPGVFVAGVAGASVADWEQMYELSDAAFKGFIEYLFAGRKDLWRERSPISHVDNMKEPLMIIHPQNDTRTPLKPMLRFMDEAAAKGKTFEAYIAPDMGHVVNTVEDALKILWPAIYYLARMEDKLGKQRA
ncbi:S9 family peptidase [Pyrofollis japonicus]|uniref:alpha/beta hydrolase family protein n=1 Tax=Pyrofollis japonicus TaxID=3060460 RepID=UPI00295AC8AF|nr:alpha/beta fold hydrolase [Pyrofollis japonicus]BEP16842.1 S9 family peptidase [Pyrofollis japonicus]